jgi:hypothetical protein
MKSHDKINRRLLLGDLGALCGLLPRFSRRVSPSLWATAVGLLLIAAGCGRPGPRPVPVSGQVLLDNRPLTDGFVRVLPETGRAAIGRIANDGRFTLTTFDKGDGCLPGTHPVEVVGRTMTGGEDSPGGSGSNAWLAPKKYADFKTSGLSVQIDGPTDSLKIALSSEAK